MTRRRGFTLLELLISMSVMLAISGATFHFFRSYELRKSEQERRTWTSFESSRISRIMSADVEGAATLKGGGSTLSLTAPGADPIQYQLEGTTLLRLQGERQETLGHSLTSAAFSIEGRTVRLHCVFTDDQPLAVRRHTEDFVATSRLGGVQ